MEPEFKTSAVMLKIPHPDGDGLGASVLALEKQGRLYNTNHMKRQLERWRLSSEVASKISGEYWAALHQIYSGFLPNRISHQATSQFVPFDQIANRLPAIKAEIGRAISLVDSACEIDRTLC